MSWMRSIVLAMAVLVTVPSVASAQWVEFIEWLDKLSGPGPFRSGKLPPFRIPILCGSREVSEPRQPRDTQVPPVAPAAAPAAKGIEWLPTCLGITALVDRDGPAKAGAPATLRERTFLIDFKYSQLTSVENDLPYDRQLNGAPLSKEAREVRVTHMGLSLRYFPHASSHVVIGADRYKFASNDDLFPPDAPLFGEFVRHAATFEIGVRPFWRDRFLRSFVVGTGIVFGLGRFTAADFGASGTYNELDNKQLFAVIGVDFASYLR
jgi:hypothetical protein